MLVNIPQKYKRKALLRANTVWGILRGLESFTQMVYNVKETGYMVRWILSNTRLMLLYYFTCNYTYASFRPYNMCLVPNQLHLRQRRTSIQSSRHSAGHSETLSLQKGHFDKFRLDGNEQNECLSLAYYRRFVVSIPKQSISKFKVYIIVYLWFICFTSWLKIV